ncbi:hypothetical protein EGJ15_24390 [Pseudomonas sp. p99-361]|nr:hypothetical protein EGJ15_24390 [Pseudomonas sp. p99-361]
MDMKRHCFRLRVIAAGNVAIRKNSGYQRMWSELPCRARAQNFIIVEFSHGSPRQEKSAIKINQLVPPLI